MAETRLRFKNRTNYRRFSDDPSTHDDDFLIAFKAQRHGEELTKTQEKLLETEEVEVVEIDTVSGPRRVFVDRVPNYEARGVVLGSDDEEESE